jgi:hypothetical protein
MYRSFLAVVVGLVVAGAVILIAESVTNRLYPPPPGMDRYDRASIRAHWKDIDVGAMLGMPVAWGLGTFAGAWLAGSMARRVRWLHSLFVGLLITLAGIAMLSLFPSPGWLWALGMAVFPVATLFGTRMVRATAKPKPLPPMVIPVRVATK